MSAGCPPKRAWKNASWSKLEAQVDGELAGQGVANFITGAAQCGVESAVVVALSIVTEHHVDGLFGTEGEVAAKAGLEVKAVCSESAQGLKMRYATITLCR
mgnify:CR=1 FL=1